MRVEILSVALMLWCPLQALRADTLVPTPSTFNFVTANTSAVAYGAYLSAANGSGQKRLSFNSYNTSLSGSRISRNIGQLNLDKVFWGTTASGISADGNANYQGIKATLSTTGSSTVNTTSTGGTFLSTTPNLSLRIIDPLSSASFTLTFTLASRTLTLSPTGSGGTGKIGVNTTGPLNNTQPPFSTFQTLNYNISACTGCGTAGTSVGYNQLRTFLGNSATRSLSSLAFVLNSNLASIPTGNTNMGPYDYEVYLYVTPEPSFYAAVALGMAGLFGFARWRRRQTASAAALPAKD